MGEYYWNEYWIRMDGTGWIHLTQNRGKWQALCQHGREPSGFVKCWEFVE